MIQSTPLYERILIAARNCFQRQGYTGASILQICREARVAPATLYRYFKNKHDLFEAAGGEALTASLADPRRSRILEAALSLFSRQGYLGTTMSEIADRAEVSRATLYGLFPSKHSILGELLNDNPFLELILRLAEHARQDPGLDPEQDLELLARQYLLFFEEPRRLALMRLILSESIRSVQLQRVFHQLVDTGLELFSRYLAVLAPDLEDPQFTAQVFMGGLQGFILSQKIIPGSTLPTHEPEKIAHLATQQLLAGIREFRSKTGREPENVS